MYLDSASHSIPSMFSASFSTDRVGVMLRDLRDVAGDGIVEFRIDFRKLADPVGGSPKPYTYITLCLK